MFSFWINILIIAYVFYISRHLFPKDELRRRYFLLLLVKVVFAVSYGLLYTYYYVGDYDSQCYHHDGQAFDWYFWNEPSRYFKILFFDEFECKEQALEFWMYGMDRAFFMSKAISVFYILLSDNYWIVTIYGAFINFLATYFLASIIVSKFPKALFSVVFAMFLLPSIQIWTSGLIRETYAVACIYLIISFWIHRGVKWYFRVPIVLLCAMFLYFGKVYYLSVIPFLFLYSLSAKIKWQYLVLSVISLMSIILMLFYESLKPILQMLLFSHDVSYYIAFYQKSNNEFGNVTTNFWTIAKSFPDVVFKACYAPMHLGNVSFIRLVEGASNLLVLSMALITITHTIIYKGKPNKEFIWLLGFILCAAFLVGITSPNFGTMVRIRVFFYPFVVLLSSWGIGQWFYMVWIQNDKKRDQGNI